MIDVVKFWIIFFLFSLLLCGIGELYGLLVITIIGVLSSFVSLILLVEHSVMKICELN